MIVRSGVQLIWQTGKYFYQTAKTELSSYNRVDVKVLDFISRMDFAFSAADLVISRAGAGTISELALTKKPVILVPSPNVAEDHQTKNAMALVKNNAALLIPDDEAEKKLIPEALKLVEDEEKLKEMANNIEKMALPESDELIVDEILKFIKK